MILVSGISYAFLMSLPFSIASFYQKVFKKKVFPYFFIISGFIYIVYFFVFSQNLFNDIGSGFFAIGGILLAATSIRLYVAMTGGD